MSSSKFRTFFLDRPSIKVPTKKNHISFRLVDVGGHEFLDLGLAVVFVSIVVQVRVGISGGVGDEDVHGDV